MTASAFRGQRPGLWRVFLRAALVAGLLASALPSAWAVVTLTLTPDRIKPGESTRITVEVDIPVPPPNRPPAHTPGEGPFFEVDCVHPQGMAIGQLTPWTHPGSMRDAEFVYNRRYRVLPRLLDTGGWRARSRFEMTYTASSNARSGEVILSVATAQSPISLGGPGAGRHDAQRRLVIVGSGGSAQPPNRPPLTGTASASNPTAQILAWAAALAAAATALVAIKRYTGRNRRPEPRAPASPDGPVVPAKPVARTADAPPLPIPTRTDTANDLPRPPEDGRQRDRRRPAPHYQLFAVRKPRPRTEVTEPDGTTRFYDYRGDGDAVVDLAVVVIPGPGWKALFGLPAGPMGPDYSPWTLHEDKRGQWYRGDVPDGAAVQYFSVKLAWQWDDLKTDLEPPEVVFYLSWEGDLSTRHGPERPSMAPEHARISVQGARPLVVVEADRGEVHATGRDRVKLDPSLFLFGAPAPEEKVAIVAVEGLPFDERPPAKQVRDGAWTAPFLLQAADLVEVVSLKPSCRWTSGPQWQRADARKHEPQPAPPIEIHLRGCAARLGERDTGSGSLGPSGSPGQPAPPTGPGAGFLPLPGQPLLASADLINAECKPVPDPMAKGAVHAKGARFRCEVRDLSQGQAGQIHGAKIPPRNPLVGGDEANPVALTPAQVDALVQATSLEDTREVRADDSGRLHTPNAVAGVPGALCVWNYREKPGLEPIDGGAVVYTLILEDGYGGVLELRGLFQARLGVLVLETGGADFRVHEHQPFCFDVRYEHPLGHVPEGESRLVWSFARIGEDGKPAALADPAQPIVTSASGIRVGERRELIVGHMPPGRDTWLNHVVGGERDGHLLSCDAGTADAAMRAELATPGWREVAPHRADSIALRRAWHASWAAIPESDRTTATVPALPWLEERDSIRWRDRVLPLGVRIELRDGANRLIATSDRYAPVAPPKADGSPAPYAGRTPPQSVWGDHRFGFVLMTLRLRVLREDIADAKGRYVAQPHAGAPLEVTVSGGEPFTVTVGAGGDVELLMPPAPSGEVEDLEIKLLNAARQPNGGRFRVKLGHLDPVERDAGVEARLNNLGLFASARVSGRTTDQLRRAVVRFEALRQLRKLSGEIGQIRREIEEAHDTTGVTQLRPADHWAQLLFFESAVPPVAHLKRTQSEAERLAPEPPEDLRDREARVAPHVPNTLRVPGDARPLDREPVPVSDRWYKTGGKPAMNKVHPDNEVLSFVDGPQTFAEMARVIRSADGPDDYIYLLGWFLGMDFELVPGEADSTIHALFGAAAGTYRVDEFARSKDHAERADQRLREAQHSTRAAVANAALLIEGPTGPTLLDDARRASTSHDMLEVAQRISDAAAVAGARIDASPPGGSAGVAGRDGDAGQAETRARAERRAASIAKALEQARLVAIAAEGLDHLRHALSKIGAVVGDPEAVSADAPPEPAGPSAIDASERAAAAALDCARRIQASTAGFAWIAPLGTALEAAAQAVPRVLPERGRDVQVRAMLWCNPVAQQNKAEVARINSLRDGAAVYDNLTQGAAGSHHQKVLVVRHGGQLTAFCGGIDINPDRVWPQLAGTPNAKGDTKGAPFHDVHCRIRGPAAGDLLTVFEQRWKHHVHGRPIDREKGPLRSLRHAPLTVPTHGRHCVQIGRTFGIPRRYVDSVSRPYPFAPQGERSVWFMIRHAIRTAQRFLYLEDQYLSSEWARDELLARLGRDPPLEHVTILIPRDDHTVMDVIDGAPAWADVPLVDIVPMGTNSAWLRSRFLWPLRERFGDRVRVFVLHQPAVDASKPEGWHTYIHNKMWIVDDRFAVVGSANCGMRSYSNDTEVAAGICDEPTNDRCSYHFAHQLRIAVWAEHLNLDTPAGRAELDDGVASASLWLRPPPGARITPYETRSGVYSPTPDALIEPQGGGEIVEPP